jgi:hypothetical protein
VAKKIKASLPSDLDLPDGYIVRWAAVDPATGAAVTGVKVSNVSLFGTALGTGDGSGGTITGPFMLVPGPAA